MIVILLPWGLPFGPAHTQTYCPIAVILSRQDQVITIHWALPLGRGRHNTRALYSYDSLMETRSSLYRSVYKQSMYLARRLIKNIM